METDSQEFKNFLETVPENEREYRTALQEFKLSRVKQKGEKEAFEKYKLEAQKVGKW